MTSFELQNLMPVKVVPNRTQIDILRGLRERQKQLLYSRRYMAGEIMWTQALVALSLSAITVLIHSLGSYLLFVWVITYMRRHRQISSGQGWWLVLRFVVNLLILHTVEVAAWARFYGFMRLFPDAETAFYYSLTSYTTVGYGDVVLHSPWRFLGAWEAMMGVLMFGWSTAALAAFAHRLYDRIQKIDDGLDE